MEQYWNNIGVIRLYWGLSSTLRPFGFSGPCAEAPPCDLCLQEWNSGMLRFVLVCGLGWASAESAAEGLVANRAKPDMFAGLRG